VLPAGGDDDLRNTIEDEELLRSFTVTLGAALVECGVLLEEGPGQVRIGSDSFSAEALSEPTMDEALSDMSDGTSEAEAVSGGGLGADGGTTSGGNVPSPLPTAGFDVGDIVRQ
jgi:hypothetical protein